MVSLRQVIVLAALFQFSVALVEFARSKLYDETDFTQNVGIRNYCDVGCRIYVSVPATSTAIAKQIIVKDYLQADKSLYDISLLRSGVEKGFFNVECGNLQVNFINNNVEFATAPIVVWMVRNDAVNIGYAKVFDASALPMAPASFDVVTVMSAVPFLLRSETDGPMLMFSTLSGFDSVNPGSDDDCTSVISQLDPDSYSDIQVAVHSPMISFYFDDVDYANTKIALTAEFGKGTTLDFSGVSFAASPGYIGCKGQQTYRSSLYDAASAYTYSSYNRLYDVTITSVLTTDDAHPVRIEDLTNQNEYKLSETTVDARDISLRQTNDIEITWTRNDDAPDQTFLIRLIPSKEPTVPEGTSKATAMTKPEQATTTTPSITKCDDIVKGVCYLIGANADSWEVAQAICKSSGAELASIHDSETNSFIRRLAVSKGKVSGLLLGAKMSEGDNEFIWADGSDWDYHNFYPGFPVNWAGECLAMDTSSTTGKWMNIMCTENLPVVCERKQ